VTEYSIMQTLNKGYSMAQIVKNTGICKLAKSLVANLRKIAAKNHLLAYVKQTCNKLKSTANKRPDGMWDVPGIPLPLNVPRIPGRKMADLVAEREAERKKEREFFGFAVQDDGAIKRVVNIGEMGATGQTMEARTIPKDIPGMGLLGIYVTAEEKRARLLKIIEEELLKIEAHHSQVMRENKALRQENADLRKVVPMTATEVELRGVEANNRRLPEENLDLKCDVQKLVLFLRDLQQFEVSNGVTHKHYRILIRQKINQFFCENRKFYNYFLRIGGK